MNKTMTGTIKKRSMLSSIKVHLRPYQRPLEKYVFPVLLVLWPLFNVWSGVDITDSTYSLGNYEGMEEGMWFFSTFLANKTGSVLMILPGGKSLLAMNIKTSLLLSVIALACYYVLQRLMPGWMIFLGEVLAISLFWCPSVILYNVLSYVFLTAACLCLFLAVNEIPRKRRYYLLAGVFLGINLFVRFSNALQVLLIVAVWAEEVWSRRKKNDILRDTFSCIGGYCLGAGGIFVWISLEYGAKTYIEAIMQLFHVDGGYTFAEMFSSTWNAYAAVIPWMLIMACCVIAGVIFFMMPLLRRYSWLKKLLYCIGILILFRFYYSRGVFTVNYSDYWCMFNWAMMFLVFVLILDLIGICGAFHATTDERFLSLVSFILILILPFGSNNYTFPILLDLFVIAPFAFWMFRRIWQETRRSRLQFPWFAMAAALIAALMVQGTFFHLQFSFRDGTDGTIRDTVVESVPRAKGMMTTQKSAQELDALYEFLEEENLTEYTILTFGDAPGLGYLFDMDCAIDTTWPDLDSYSEESFEKELADLGGLAFAGHAEQMPVVILRVDEDHPYGDEALAELKGGTAEDRKAILLRTFLEEGDYETVATIGDFLVKVPSWVESQGE